MPPAATEKESPELSCSKSGSDENRRRFPNLRGVQWRIDLGILPSSSSSSSSSIDDLRRVTADSRRRYAALRRRLLVDPPIQKDGSSSPDLVIDNPLSQNPDSTWGRFFRNAELEKTVDQDLSRLYPEHGSYFQTPGCQGMLRRILLLWCLRNPECGYRQGMHELLAPLLFVLHVDVEHLSKVRKQYEEHFTDKFDDLPLDESDLTYNFDFKKFFDSMGDEIGSQGNAVKVRSLLELDPKIQTIVLLSDAYGAEGELGIVLSEKFMEHDAYCMFNALMNGSHGSVAMADFFSPSPVVGSHSALPPVIEASSALYHLLSVVDPPLYSHLVELGVEPQYFALRWLRVLFGREFPLENLLLIWDEIFAADNNNFENSSEYSPGSQFKIFNSPRGALISAMAVSMILKLRSSLLATENATTCLQRLLNFTENVDLKKLIDKAKSLQVLALETNVSPSPPLFDEGYHNRSKSLVTRSHSISSDTPSPKTPLNMVRDSYWEEKWRDLHKDEGLSQGSSEKKTPNRKIGWLGKAGLILSRTEADPSPAKLGSHKQHQRPSVGRSLPDDLSHELQLDADTEKAGYHEVSSKNILLAGVGMEGQDGIDNEYPCTADERCLSGLSRTESDPSPAKLGSHKEHQRPSVGHSLLDDLSHELQLNADTEKAGCHEVSSKNSLLAGVGMEGQDGIDNEYPCTADERCLSGSCSSENSSVFSEPSSPHSCANDHENDLEKSSVASNLSMNISEGHVESIQEDSTLPVSHSPGIPSLNSEGSREPSVKPVIGSKDQKLLSGKFQWVWKFGRNTAGEGTSEEGSGPPEAALSANNGNRISTTGSSSANGRCNSNTSGKGDAVDQNVMGTLKNLGQSMLEHIQVIESVFQQERGQVGSLENFSRNVLVGKGQVTAMTALKELRKISNLLSEM